MNTPNTTQHTLTVMPVRKAIPVTVRVIGALIAIIALYPFLPYFALMALPIVALVIVNKLLKR